MKSISIMYSWREDSAWLWLLISEVQSRWMMIFFLWSIHVPNWFQFSILFCYCFYFHFTWPLPEEDGDLSCHNNERVGSLASYPSRAIVTARSHKPRVISLAPVVSSPWSERPAAHLHGFFPVCRSPTAAPQVFVWLSVAYHYRFIAWVSGVIHVVCHSPLAHADMPQQAHGQNLQIHTNTCDIVGLWLFMLWERGM